MDAIYENAMLTIIAAAGRDETYGLPGVSRRARTPQPIIKQPGMTIIWKIPNPRRTIKSSRWATRGWTFQEALLSQRRLVFLDDQVYFECNTMNCCETAAVPLHTTHANPEYKTFITLQTGVLSNTVPEVVYRHEVSARCMLWMTMVQYFSIILEYSARKLRFDTDSLNAFRGVIRQYSKREQAMFSIMGLPYPAASDARIDMFLWALSWYHNQTIWGGNRKPRRRHEFPSWAWVGWEGQVKYENDPKFQPCSDNMIASLSFEDENGQVVELTKLQGLDTRIYPALKMNAPVLPSALFSYDPSSDQKWSWTLNVNTKLTGGARLYLSQGPDSEAQFAAEMKEGDKWRCTYTGSAAEHSYIVVLGPHPDITGSWLRAGVFIIYCSYEMMVPWMEDIDWEISRIL
ncbi:hypothetical protein F5B20DRAFT_554119 [Whalleya microplaca]|nr:hypothetical protein F5B20DRAFT_554119 [Whalleya microplaca]